VANGKTPAGAGRSLVGCRTGAVTGRAIAGLPAAAAAPMSALDTHVSRK
jgi:hypothetical protein